MGEKKEGAVDCALENPSVFTPTVDEELTMFVSKIYEELTHRKNQRRHCMPLISYFNVRGTYTGEDIQKLTTNYADLERGAKGDIECPRSNKGDIKMLSIQLVLSTQRTYTREMAS